MANLDVQSWSTTAADNDNADGAIDWTEGQPRNTVNNSARGMMAAIAKDRDLKNGSIVTGGTFNVQLITSPIPYTVMPTGLRILVKIGPGLTNTGSTTLNLDGLGAVTIKTCFGTELVGGEMVAGAYSEFVYDGTNWILIRDPRAGLTLLVPQAVSGAASSLFTGISSIYDEYLFILCGVLSSANDDLKMQVSTDAGVTWKSTSGDYRQMIQVFSDAGTSVVGGGATETWIGISGTTSNNVSAGLSGEVRLFTPANTTHYKVVQWHISYYDGTNFKSAMGSCTITVAAALNGVRFLFNSGTITGTISMYGIKK